MISLSRSPAEPNLTPIEIDLNVTTIVLFIFFCKLTSFNKSIKIQILFLIEKVIERSFNYWFIGLMMILDLKRLKLFEAFLNKTMSDSLIEKSREAEAE